MARQAVAGWLFVIDFRVSLFQAKQEMYQSSAARKLKPRKPANAEKPPARPEAFLVRRFSFGYYSKTGSRLGVIATGAMAGMTGATSCKRLQLFNGVLLQFVMFSMFLSVS